MHQSFETLSECPHHAWGGVGMGGGGGGGGGGEGVQMTGALLIYWLYFWFVISQK